MFRYAICSIYPPRDNRISRHNEYPGVYAVGMDYYANSLPIWHAPIVRIQIPNDYQTKGSSPLTLMGKATWLVAKLDGG